MSNDIVIVRRLYVRKESNVSAREMLFARPSFRGRYVTFHIILAAGRKVMTKMYSERMLCDLRHRGPYFHLVC